MHKTANVLDKLPKGSQPKAKRVLHEICLAETKAAAEQAFDLFVKTYEAKYPKATECLVKDRDVLLAFYDFPAEHGFTSGRPTRSRAPSLPCATARSDRKGSGLSNRTALAMVFKLLEAAQKPRTLGRDFYSYWREGSFLFAGPLQSELVCGTADVHSDARTARACHTPEVSKPGQYLHTLRHGDA